MAKQVERYRVLAFCLKVLGNGRPVLFSEPVEPLQYVLKPPYQHIWAAKVDEQGLIHIAESNDLKGCEWHELQPEQNTFVVDALMLRVAALAGQLGKPEEE